MDPKTRRQELVSLVNVHQEMAVDVLADRLGVSKETIRRDLAELASKGRLRKFHGGAKVMLAAAEAPETESPFSQRVSQNAEAKRRIATATAKLFQPGDSIFIDTGSTTIMVAEALLATSYLTVMTNSPVIAATLAADRSNKIFLIGGAYAPEVGENLGPLAIDQIAKFRAQHVILTIGAINPAGIMDFDLQEAEIAQAMLERAETVTVVADQSKFGRSAVFEVAQLSALDRIVTERHPSAIMADALRKADVEIVAPLY